jgi:peptidyl-prolyl cis-trans isomerase D
MIQALRDRITGWLALVIVLMLAFVVGIWGIAAYFVPTTENYIAKIDDVEIDQNDYQRRFGQYREQMRAMMGEGFDARYFEQPTVKREFVDNLVRQRLLRRAAVEAGLVAPVSAVKQQITEIQAFQVDGKFNSDSYLNALRRQGLTATGFEELLTEELEVNRIPESLRESGFATDAEIDLIATLRDQKRTFRYFELSDSAIKPTIKPTDAEIKRTTTHIPMSS